MTSQILRSMLFMTALTALLIALKKVLNKHITAAWQYRIDYLFFVILALPIVPCGKKATNITRIIIPDISTGALQPTVQQNNAFNDFAVNTNMGIDIAACIWAAGLILFVIAAIVSLRKLTAETKESENADENICRIFKRCADKTGVNGKIKVKIGNTQSPMVFGLFNTVILLPHIKLADKEIENVLMHELIHYKRGDVVVNFISCIFRAVYWFNPVVWAAFSIMRDDMETACDEAVMELTGDRYGYGMTIIKFAQRKKIINFAADMGGSAKQIKNRVEAAAVFTKATFGKKLVSGLSFVMAFVLILTQIPNISVMAFEKNAKIGNADIKSEDLSEYFDGFGGSFVLYDMNNESYTVYNEKESIKRTSPDSTYKIFSALAALESGIITPEGNTIKWDGTENQFDEWNKDQNLSSAMKNSVNWYFQQLDSKNFKELYELFNTIGYGNCDFSGGKDFWMESSLKISPIEQTQALKSLYCNEYGFDEKNVEAVKDAIKIDKGFYGKTGTGMINGKEINGWFVGFVEQTDNVYFFATNINGYDNALGSTAADITIEILGDRGIINYED